MFREDFAIFILTHGRPKNISTLKEIKKGNYSGKLYFLIDNEDNEKETYKQMYGEENVIIFDKEKVLKSTDTMDNFNEKRAILYARREVFEVAKKLDLKYFLMLEDDFTGLMYRFVEDGKLKGIDIKSFDDVINAMIDFLDVSNAMTVCMCQGGDFIGGAESRNAHKGLLRKSMNSFFCKVDRFIDFRGTMNEDVTTYTTLGSRGQLFFSVVYVNIVQQATQSKENGMTEVYQENGTYTKSFYSVMSMPSCVKISTLTDKHTRIHHNVNWNNCVPKILSERVKHG